MSGKKKILLIDDDPLICEMTRDVLERLGYITLIAMTAEAARAVFLDDPEQFDLVMIDHILSDQNGVELAADLLRIRPDIFIALYTGGNVELEGVLSKGIRAVITKALSREEFREALERIFDDE